MLLSLPRGMLTWLRASPHALGAHRDDPQATDTIARWVWYNDRFVTPIGTWAQAASFVVQGGWQPSLLIYEQ